MGLVGKIEYGTWKDGSSIYKDSKGYYYVAVNAEGMYKKHLKSWKPAKEEQLCFVNKRWKTCKAAAKGKKAKSKTRRL